METVRTVARHNGPRGEVLLRRRSADGPDVDELIINGVFAMESSDTSTECALADLALAGQTQCRVLLGGLGLGYTAAQLLTSAVARLDVVEIEECLVEWANAELTPTLASIARDPRTALHVVDITTVLTGRKDLGGSGGVPPESNTDPRGPWHAIVLDVDNGPDFLIHRSNSALYTWSTLAAAYAQLAGGGTLAIWCQGPVPELLATLRQISPTAEPHTYRRIRQGRRLSYVIYTLTKT